ncbi:hypothetical protein C8F04DRAFT_1270043 [Mycena alexandri]|uniref:Uncharacterized protein n=1 Tax=Mycena alexandri TaxID=1745969 RepID=A0AAD6SBT3_9AGAR|nr:hypothetical protein C8F04DRAFT_1270043 [Mycena alexandri]
MNISFFYPPASGPRSDNNGNKDMMPDGTRPEKHVGDASTSASAQPGNSQHHGGGSGAIIGKFEQKLGALVGSDTLKAKGLKKAEEPHAPKVPNQDRAEA